MFQHIFRSMAVIFAILLISPTYVIAENVPFSDDRWEIEGAESRIETVAGKEALYIKNGAAFLKDAEFHNGTIEFDILSDGGRGFSGAYFRFTDPKNGEHFYIRPHQSGNEDANQYTPVFNGLAGWQMYFGPAFSAPITYKVNEWIHIKIVVLETLADVYIDGDEPLFHVAELKQANVAGWIGLNSGFAPVHFANFSYEKSDDVEIIGTPAEMKETAPGTIETWLVSRAFDEALLVGPTLPDAVATDQSWQALKVEDWGYANLARVQGISEGATAVMAKINISTDEAITKTLVFGYSDRVKVYLNRVLLYAGNNGYMTRDYRYLGTIGLFDEVALPLNAGINELVFAVAESFGGWGVMAKMDDLEGVTITP